MSGTRPEPEIELRQLSAASSGQKVFWRIAWLLTNRGAQRLRLQAVRLPHGQFKSDKKRFEPAIDLEPGEQTQFQIVVRCEESPGDVTENAFVIFYVVWWNDPWRVFARIRVAVSADGTPQATTELITTQKAGFSQGDLP